MSQKPQTVLAVYRLKPQSEDQFSPMLKTHYPTLRGVGLVTEQKPMVWRATGRDGGVTYLEIFQWVDEKAADVAHQTPEVMQIWEPMGPLLADLEILALEEAKL